MATQILQVLGSYDLFGKSVPGAALLFGIWTLFPDPPFISTDSGGNLVDIAALLIILLLFGLMIGQGLHTLADNMEKAFRWIVVRIDEARLFFQLKGVNLNLKRIATQTDPATLTGIQKFVPGWQNGIVEWIRRRFWGTFDSFAGHRYLLGKWIQWNYPPSGRDMFDDRWELHQYDDLLEPFAESVEDNFDINIRQLDPEEIEVIYPRITTYLSSRNERGYRQFQAIYSFCRSMWVVLLVLTIAYSFALYQPLDNTGVISDSPAIVDMLPKNTEQLLPIITFFSSIMFMDAAGTYKRHFIEYMVASFANQDGTIQEQNQQTLDQF